MKKSYFFPKAQSTLELILIIILVLGSITVMGPYVIRSVNAYMRSWEISVQQSKHDYSVKMQGHHYPGANPPLPANCAMYYNNESACRSVVGEDGSRCWWRKEYRIKQPHGHDECVVDYKNCVPRNKAFYESFLCCVHCGPEDQDCLVTDDFGCYNDGPFSYSYDCQNLSELCDPEPPVECNYNGMCEPGENCENCPEDCCPCTLLQGQTACCADSSCILQRHFTGYQIIETCIERVSAAVLCDDVNLLTCCCIKETNYMGGATVPTCTAPDCSADNLGECISSDECMWFNNYSGDNCALSQNCGHASLCATLGGIDYGTGVCCVAAGGCPQCTQ